MKLELNYNKMGYRHVGETWEWYTVEVGKIGNIHIHNDTPSGRWTYRIRTSYEINSKNEFDTKEDAFTSSVNYFTMIATKAIELMSA